MISVVAKLNMIVHVITQRFYLLEVPLTVWTEPALSARAHTHAARYAGWQICFVTFGAADAKPIPSKQTNSQNKTKSKINMKQMPLHYVTFRWCEHSDNETKASANRARHTRQTYISDKLFLNMPIIFVDWLIAGLIHRHRSIVVPHRALGIELLFAIWLLSRLQSLSSATYAIRSVKSVRRQCNQQASPCFPGTTRDWRVVNTMKSSRSLRLIVNLNLYHKHNFNTHHTDNSVRWCDSNE